MAIIDITVRGAGIFGLSIAWACLKRGARVRIVDPYGVAAGASGGIVGALAPHTPEQWDDKKAFQLESLLMMQDYWGEIAEITGLEHGYARFGRLQPVVDEAGLDLARFRINSARELWQGRAKWDVVRADTCGDWAPFSPTGWLIHDTLSARLHPKQASTALAAACVARGAEIVTEAPDAGQVIWATGVAGLDQLTQWRGRLVGAGVKGQAALLDYDARGLPQLFAEWVHFVPHSDGTCAVGSTTERYFDAPNDTDEMLEDILVRARKLVPALKDAPVILRWAGQRPRSKRRAPMLGQHPMFKGQFIANGGFKIGFGMAPKVGEVMADLMLEARDIIPDDFRVEACL